MKYRKKPVVIEAIQFLGPENWQEVQNFFGAAYQEEMPAHFIIPTLEGQMKANIGDWIIKGVQGEFYPCKPDIFEATYEKVES